MPDIDKLKEGVRRVGMAEPVIALAPFMGDVVDKAMETYERAKDYFRPAPAKRTGDIELPSPRRKRQPAKRRTLGDLYGK